MGRAFEFRKARKLKRWATMAKTFTGLSKDIAIAVKDGGPNIDSNFKLRSIIQNAKAANMPKDNIERAIKNASNKNFENYKEVVLEGYSIGGIAVILDCISDNNNRTVGNIRSYFNKTNGNLATNGSVEFIFKKICFFKIKFDGNKDELVPIEFINELDNRLSAQKGIKVDFQSVSEANHFFSKTETPLIKSLNKYIKKETALY